MTKILPVDVSEVVNLKRPWVNDMNQSQGNSEIKLSEKIMSSFWMC